LRCKVRQKDGKQHRYWSVVENTRVAGGRVGQRHVLYLGEINDTQELAWRRSIAVLEDGASQPPADMLSLPGSERHPLPNLGTQRRHRGPPQIAIPVHHQPSMTAILPAKSFICYASLGLVSLWALWVD
jgi:hypothetical protein